MGRAGGQAQCLGQPGGSRQSALSLSAREFVSEAWTLPEPWKKFGGPTLLVYEFLMEGRGGTLGSALLGFQSPEAWPRTKNSNHSETSLSPEPLGHESAGRVWAGARRKEHGERPSPVPAGHLGDNGAGGSPTAPRLGIDISMQPALPATPRGSHPGKLRQGVVVGLPTVIPQERGGSGGGLPRTPRRIEHWRVGGFEGHGEASCQVSERSKKVHGEGGRAKADKMGCRGGRVLMAPKVQPRNQIFGGCQCPPQVSKEAGSS